MPRNLIEIFHDNKLSASSSSLSLCYAGKEKCLPMHHFGPATRAHYLLHFVLSGKGDYHVNGKQYRLCANQMFLIKPSETTFYIADDYEPWEYIWIAFHGRDVETILGHCGLLGANPTGDYLPSEKLLASLEDIILQLQDKKTMNEYAILGNLYSIFGLLSQKHFENEATYENLYVKQAVSFIQNNYNYDIKVQDIADSLQIDRTYLYRLFMAHFNLSPKQYLLGCRLKAAMVLLNNSLLSVSEIAYTCGFSDPSSFCRCFREQLGFTPKAFRNIDGDTILSFIDPRIQINDLSVKTSPKDENN